MDITTLFRPTSFSIRALNKEKGSKKKKKSGDSERAVYTCEITRGSNILMNEMKNYINTHLPDSQIECKEDKYLILEDVFPPFLSFMCYWDRV